MAMEHIYSMKPWLKFYDAGVPVKIKYPEITMGQAISSSFSTHANRDAIIFMGVRITYREIDELSNCFANFLLRIGCKPGDVVGYHGPNVPAGLITAAGIHKAGCVYTGVSPLYTPEELKYQLNDSGAKVLVSFDPLSAIVAKVVGDTCVKAVLFTAPTDFIPNVPVSDKDLPAVSGIEIKRFKKTIDEMSSNPVMTMVGLDDPCVMMYTGGTTGTPKGAIVAQRSMLVNVMQFATWWGLIPGDEIFSSAYPIFHAAGNMVQLVSFYLGATNILLPDPRNYQKLIADFKQYRPTLYGHVPSVYLELMKMPEFQELDFSGIRYMISAASPFPADNIRELEKIVGTGRLIEAYGMTEATCIAIANPSMGTKKIGSIGMPICDAEVKIVDPETGQAVSLGEEGELLLKGPFVMKGYHKKPEETAETLKDGWLHTGDIARMDEEGYVFIVDRLKDMISVSGMKVFSKQVDDVLAEHPSIAVAATIGLPDPARPGAEIVASAIILMPGEEKTDALKEDIVGYLRGRLAPYKVPKIIEFVDQLPLSAVGKILKRDLRKIMRPS